MEGFGVEDKWPFIEHFSHKKSVKGEDFTLSESDLQWTWPGTGKVQHFALFAVFDGHGGAKAAQECKTAFVQTLHQALNNVYQSCQEKNETVQWEQNLLPYALVQTFMSLNKICCEKYSSGTTATVVVISLTPNDIAPKWARITVANVGDSHAYAELGAGHLFRLNVDHRLDNNASERERVVKEGGEVERAGKNADDKNDPLRLWPGGLMMSRSIGDPDAVQATAEANIRSLLVRLVDEEESGPLPCKIILASDGLWDVVSGKQAFALAKRKNPQAAANSLVNLAYKKAVEAREKDDISITVIDIAHARDGFSHSSRTRLMSHCSTTSKLSTCSVLSVRKDSVDESDAVHPNTFFFMWRPRYEPPPYNQVEAYEKALAEAKAAVAVHEEALERERQEMEEALRMSLEAEEVLKSVEGASLEDEDDGWEPVGTNPRKEKRRNKKQAQQVQNDNAQGVEEEESQVVEGQQEELQQGDTAAGRQEKVRRKKDKKAGSKVKVCVHFRRGGKCKRGEQCTFSHDLCENQESETNGNIDQTFQDKEAESNGAMKEKRKQKVCFKFQQTGSCRHGDSCKFIHPLPPTENPQEQDREQGEHHVEEEPSVASPQESQDTMEGATKSKGGSRICREFKQSGSCRFGDKCKFQHASNSLSKAPAANSQSKAPAAKDKRRKQNNYDLFVTGLDESVRKEDLRQYFDQFGEISVFNVKFENKSKGYAFISFHDPQSHLKVLNQEMHLLGESVLAVSKFVPRG